MTEREYADMVRDVLRGSLPTGRDPEPLLQCLLAIRETDLRDLRVEHARTVVQLGGVVDDIRADFGLVIGRMDRLETAVREIVLPLVQRP